MIPKNSVSRWIFTPTPSPSARIRLICFHYAGGSAQIFRPFAEALGETIEVVGIQLPGRADRMADTPFTRMGDLIPVLSSNLVSLFDKPFALFGQCMGGLVAFELARELRKSRIRPLALFASAIAAPQTRRCEPYHDLPDEDFIRELMTRAGKGPNMNLLDDPRFRPIFLKYLRADAELAETYTFQEGPPLEFPIIACGGEEDPKVSRDDLAAWGNLTSRQFTVHIFPGGRFYWLYDPKPLLASLKETLRGFASGPAGPLDSPHGRTG